MKSTFSVIFYLKRQAVKKDGTVPVMGRITVDGTQTQFSSKLSVDPKLWDTKGGRVTGRSSAALETNRLLDKMRVSINRHYQEIMERDNFVTAEKVKNAFLGLEHRCHTLMQVFRQHNEDYAKQVEAGMKAKATLSKYLVVYKHLQEFLNIRYHVKDIALKELTPAFISDFEMFLRTDKHCCTNTVWLYVCPLRTMVFIAINNEWLARDHHLRKPHSLRRQPGNHRRQHRTRHDSETEHHRHTGPAASKENRHRIVIAPGALPRLLRHRHGKHGAVHRVQGRHRLARRPQNAACD